MSHRPGIRLAALVAVFAFAAAPSLAVTSSYTFNINTNGNPVTDVFIYAQAGGLFDLHAAPGAIAPSGTQTLLHDTAFDPDSVLVLGVNQDDVEGPHVIMFTSTDFAYSSVGLRYNQAFDSTAAGYLGHNLLITTIQAAHAGDADALDKLTAYIQGPGSAAAFEYGGSFAVVEFSVIDVPIGGSVPEPATTVLGGLALCGLSMALGRRQGCGRLMSR